ncbi:MAG: DNA mismatch repair endonuclease MutL [Prevotella sp.]|uniref:DNA mismatch repair endonuclease MutL n=1 Tax=Prevotella sp. P5-92 TaxID=2024222 RepID=UPI000B977CD9|nr:DNA mismatch repair endonuclease MutL [Prevotella sp. P5-92]MCI7400879.1 DNA mismatch repair endonuclease MutL [Prevotella sp.]MDD6820005.1 DNA mismatch repair endonuclease MutL [Prevotella sp.]MDY4654325.1 DNA mismatch repair endonuclease MutL [Prevotella sp.]OYP55158.1 DNA mismatch repair protein MutL [Prevotella sp. P5-92]
MSDVIQLLPDSVANQIAAGEVIQRPASVIKELVENAIDADAKRIDVVVVDAGRTSIQVIDDGRGMSETDARLAFERHATSKIRKADDLFALSTMGFRGEALASIAAVAQVKLKTRMSESEVGTELVISASKVVQQQPISCPVGSNFIVDNLFFNVPARRKFLKTNTTELNNILTAYERITLVYPDIAFTLHSNGTELINLRPGSLRQRIVDVFGKRLNQVLLPVEVDTSLCRIKGFVGKPESAKKKGAHQFFFVNGRYMKHPYFHKAIMNAFDRLVAVGMQVPYFIYFDVNPSDIDVNIHPTKTEIKFENEQPIWQILSAAVNDAIGKFCEIPSIDFDTEGKPDIPLFDPQHETYAPPQPQYNASYNPFKTHSEARQPAVPDRWEDLYNGLGDDDPVPSRPEATQQSFDFSEPIMSEANSDFSERSLAHYQYKGHYIMTAVKSGLMIVDQQRADMRIRFERYMKQMETHISPSQQVLFPEVVQFPASLAVLLNKVLPEINNMGFDLTDLGQNSYSINGVPAGLEGIDCKALLVSMLDDAADNVSSSTDALRRSLALTMARAAAIPVGQVLSNVEMESLINELFTCSNVNYTPDGKAIICILPQREIEQLMG